MVTSKLQNCLLPDNVHLIGSRIQAGIAIPERNTMLQSSNRIHNPPGMSTPLPEKRLTGVRNMEPVLRIDSLAVDYTRILLLEPMRVRARGEYNSDTNLPITLNGPKERWPGSIYSCYCITLGVAYPCNLEWYEIKMG